VTHTYPRAVSCRCALSPLSSAPTGQPVVAIGWHMSVADLARTSRSASARARWSRARSPAGTHAAIRRPCGRPPPVPGTRCGSALTKDRVGHSVGECIAESAYRPEIRGLREWARGELNHLKTPVNAGLQAVRAYIYPISGYLGVRGAPDAPSGGTCPTRVQPDVRMVGARPVNCETYDLAPRTLRPATSTVGDLKFCPQTATVGGPPTASSVTERATAGSVPAPVTVCATRPLPSTRAISARIS
jgi:hypothetical protein